MSAPNDGGPAFPCECEWDTNSPTRGVQTGNAAGVHMGMTLRDYFAAKAMHAALCTASGHATEQHVVDAAAKVAYMAADSMLKAREVES